MLESPKSTKYLNTKEPFGWFSAEANEKIHNEWYECDPQAPNYGYKSWNEWFLR